MRSEFREPMSADDVMRVEWHRERARAQREDPPPLDDRPTLSDLLADEHAHEEGDDDE